VLGRRIGRGGMGMNLMYEQRIGIAGMELKNIVLIGFMGTGKSSVGRRLAKIFGWEFIDTDSEIEKTTGMSVAEIFRRHGEVRFRSEEVLVVRKLKTRTRCVIATGGGTVLNPENWQLLQSVGLMICLYAPLDTVLERVSSSRNERPLLKGDRQAIEKLWLNRQAVYNRADIVIDTTGKDIDSVVQEVIKRIREKGYEVYGLAKN